MRFLLLLLVLVPVVEMYFLIKVGGVIGALPTVALVILTAAIGAAMLRRQGLATAFQVREALARGERPTVPLVEGIFILAGGALLLTPGFVTDVLGFACLLPPLRRRLTLAVLRRAMRQSHQHGGFGGPGRRDSSSLIEGEFRRED
jgi:UPF0716 protein FxsA